eukprot:5397837-Pleurochrysis_carterae.AAC.2
MKAAEKRGALEGGAAKRPGFSRRAPAHDRVCSRRHDDHLALLVFGLGAAVAVAAVAVVVVAVAVAVAAVTSFVRQLRQLHLVFLHLLVAVRQRLHPVRVRAQDRARAEWVVPTRRAGERPPRV